MPNTITVPKLGVSTEPVLLAEWKTEEGHWTDKGAVLLVIETEKITFEVEAEVSGFVHVLVGNGNEAPIGSVVGLIAETKEELGDLQRPALPAEANTVVSPREELAEAKTAVPVPTLEPAEESRVRISPVARKMAKERGIDITELAGSGPDGRIVREDIERQIEIRSNQKPALPGTTVVVCQPKKVKSTIPLKGTRKTIAEHLHRSLSIAAQVTVMGEIDATELRKLRQALQPQEQACNTRFTWTSLLTFVLSRTLAQHPEINVSIVDDEIKLWEDINIGIAVATDYGLIVPVVKNTESKSLVEISQEVRTLAEKARERTLVPEQVEGGTFTLSNLGALGGGYRFETVIIRQPESAILGTGGVADRAVVRAGEIVIRPIMTYYFTYDHRVIDGAVAAGFIASLIRLLETPALLLA